MFEGLRVGATVRLGFELIPVASLMVGISGRGAFDLTLGSIRTMGNHLSPMVSIPSYMA